MKSFILLISVCLIKSTIDCSPVKIPAESKTTEELDPLEHTAKLLIELDEKIERGLESGNNTVFVKYPQLYIPPNESEIAVAREEKFSDVLRDLTALELNLEDEIRKAIAGRRFSDAARLRPLLTYVRYIRSNLDQLRNRFVAIATVTSIASTVNEVVDRFGDVMTSGAAGVVLPDPATNPGIVQPLVTAFSGIRNATNPRRNPDQAKTDIITF